MFTLKPVLDLSIYFKSMNQRYQVTRSNGDTKYSRPTSTIRINVREIASLQENFRIQCIGTEALNFFRIFCTGFFFFFH